MTTSDRAFVALLAAALAVSLVLALPLVLTLFPGEVQQALHGYDSLVRACAAAVYHFGERLPPLGGITLVLAAVGIASAFRLSSRMLLRTRSLARRRASAPMPEGLARIAADLGIAQALRCFDHPLPLAYTAGLRSPEIWLSSAMVELLSPDELHAVLLHERAHLRRRDPLRLVIARTVAAGFGLVPWIGALASRFEVAKELDADREAIAHGHAAALAGALYAIGERSLPQDLAVGAWSLSAARIDQLYGTSPDALLPRPVRRSSALSVITLAIALLLSFGQAARANVLPAALIEGAGFSTDDASAVHACPIPTEGVLF